MSSLKRTVSLARRYRPTHDPKQFTWDDLLSEAFGELGLHPWDFERYTFREYVARRKGMAARDVSEWHKMRFLAYYAAGPYLKKGTKISDILPLPGDPKRLKDLKGEDLKEWYERRKEMERAAGLRNE